MKIVPPLLAIAMAGCASTTVYYPSTMTMDSRGGGHPVSRKAIQLYGDSLGKTTIRVAGNSVEYTAEGGNINSVVTAKIFDSATSVARWTIGWGFSYGILNSLFGHAGAAYATHQATTPATVAKPAPLPSVGSTIPAQTSAVVTAAP